MPFPSWAEHGLDLMTDYLPSESLVDFLVSSGSCDFPLAFLSPRILCPLISFLSKALQGLDHTYWSWRRGGSDIRLVPDSLPSVLFISNTHTSSCRHSGTPWTLQPPDESLWPKMRKKMSWYINLVKHKSLSTKMHEFTTVAIVEALTV